MECHSWVGIKKSNRIFVRWLWFTLWVFSIIEHIAVFVSDNSVLVVVMVIGKPSSVTHMSHICARFGILCMYLLSKFMILCVYCSVGNGHACIVCVCIPVFLLHIFSFVHIRTELQSHTAVIVQQHRKQNICWVYTYNITEKVFIFVRLKWMAAMWDSVSVLSF